jgi:hypothetical protein
VGQQNVLLWDDASAKVVLMPDVSGTEGGGAPVQPFSFFWDPAQKPPTSNAEDEEFEGSELDARWKKIGTWELGGVARGASFTSPADLVKYSINTDRASHLVMQMVADPLAEFGQGLYRELLPENRNGDDVPTNWLLKVAAFSEIDLSSIPMSNADNALYVMMAEKLPDGSPDFDNWVGFFVQTDFADMELPYKVAMVQSVAPDDGELVGDFISMPALPSFNQLKLHKVGTKYRGSVMIDGRSTQLGEVDLPTLNPTVYVLLAANTDTPNCLTFCDSIRHEFVDKEAA